MASKFFVVKSQVYNNPALTGTTPVTSQSIDMQAGKSKACLIVNVNSGGGNLTGSMKLLASDDKTNWGDTGIILPAIASGAAIVPIALPADFPFLQLQITPATGTGAVTVTFSGKDLG